MEFLIGWMVYGVISMAVVVVRRFRKAGEKSLCLTCMNAVVTRGTRGQKWVACNLAGALRPVKFTVCECTAFCVPGGPAKLVTIEGFAPEKHEVYAEVAIARSRVSHRLRT